MQRWRNHKLRNVLERLPEAEQAQVRSLIRAAWKLDAKSGMARLEKLAQWLEREYPDAAGSLREGMVECFTINRLDVPLSLHRCLATTNLIESPQSGVRMRTRRVCRWRDQAMVKRWAGASMSQPDAEVPDGVYLVRVDQVRYRRERQKPFYSVRFAVVEPAALAGHVLAGRLYCTPKALWKFSWFLRDFGYDAELFGREEIEDKALIGLSGVLKVSHTVVHGRSLLNLDAFAPAGAAGIGPHSAYANDTARKAGRRSDLKQGLC